MARAVTGPRFLVGTSGFSYAPWRGTFYPKELASEDMLKFYSSVFGTVEINHSFYRMPTPTLLTNWRRQTPLRFRFALKAPQRITHHLRLNVGHPGDGRIDGAIRTLGDLAAALA